MIPNIFGIFRSLGNRNYRLLWVITALTNAALWSHIMVTGWYLFDLTHSSFWVGANMFAVLLPNLLGGPIAGVLADRMDRKRLISLSIGVSFIVQLLLTIYCYTAGLTSAFLLILFTFIYGTAMSMMGVALNALLPGMVPKNQLFNAISLQALAQRGTEFIGPVLSGWIMMNDGIGAVFLFCAVLIGGSLALCGGMAAPVEATAELQAGFIKPMAEGFRYIRRAPVIKILLLIVAMHCGLTMAYMGVLPELIQSKLTGDTELYNRMISFIGLGAVIGTLVLSAINNERRRGELYLISGLLSALCLITLAAGQIEGLLLLSAIGVGLSQAMFMTLSVSYIQDVVENQLRGRVMSVFLLLAAGLMSVANWVYGGIVNVISPEYLIIGLSSLFTLFFLIMLVASVVLRSICLGKRSALETGQSLAS